MNTARLRLPLRSLVVDLGQLSRLPALIVAAALLAGCTSAANPEQTGTQSTTTSVTATDTSTDPVASSVPSPDLGSSTTESGQAGNFSPAWRSVNPGPNNTATLLGLSTALSKAERGPRFNKLEQDAGRFYDIGHVFHSWDQAIGNQDDLMHIEDDRLLLISWNGTDTKEIAAGEHDDWIRSQAQATRDLESDVLVRWLWEMDGRRRLAWVHSGPDYVAAWNHVRAIFDEEGAGNAEFVWCPNEFLFWDGGDPEPWYPGDDNVDWLCADGYNWSDTKDSEEWVDLVEIFGDFYAWAEPKGKPIIIGETGVSEAEPGAKAEWLREIPSTLREELPEIDAFVYFDKDFRDFGFVDWRVDTSPDAYEAWIEMSNDPWLNGANAG